MGEREITPKADIYALGCVLYEMLTAEPPFTGATAQAIIARVMTEEPRSLTLQRKTIPPHVEAATRRALEKLPADRWGSAAEFGAALADERLLAYSRTAAQPSVGASVRPGVLPWAVTLVAVATAVWSLTRGTGAPSVYDVGLTDSVAMVFPDEATDFSLSARADFMVYTGQHGDTLAQLNFRSLTDLGAHAVAGTEGAGLPRVSPDGRRLAFVQAGKVKVVSIEGGQARVLAEVYALTTLEWVSSTRLLAVDNDGRSLKWLDAEAGQTSASTLTYCIEAQWLASLRQLLCGGGAEKVASLLDPAGIKVRPLRAPAEGRGDTASGPLLGSAFRVVDGRYLVYMSLDGDLRATTFDAASGRTGRSVTVVPGIRREAYSGAGQFAITPQGALVYVPGPNAEIGRLVRTREAGVPQPLPIEQAAFLRYDLSPDGRRLAATVQGIGWHELRVYDLRDGRHQVWLTAREIGQPLWSPRGNRLVVDVSDSVRSAVLSGSPESAAPPETLLAWRGSRRDLFVPYDYHDEHLLLGVKLNDALVVRGDPTTRPMRFDTILKDASFPVLSSDGRRLSWRHQSNGEVLVAPYPSLDRRVHVTTTGTEPLWLSPTDLLFRDYPSWFRARIDAGTTDMVGSPQRWLRDARFADTPGWSNRILRDGSLLYLQGPEQTRAAFVRVIPRWTSQMKRAVDAANRR
jgi:hypothetical protein